MSTSIQPDANASANTNTSVVLTALPDAQSAAEALREEVKALRKERNDAHAELERLRAQCNWLQRQNETLAGHQAQFLEYQIQAEVNLQEQAAAAQARHVHDAAEIDRLTTEARALLQQRDTAGLDQQIIRAALEASQSDAADTEKTLSATVKDLEIISAKYAKLQGEHDDLKRQTTNRFPRPLVSTGAESNNTTSGPARSRSRSRPRTPEPYHRDRDRSSTGTRSRTPSPDKSLRHVTVRISERKDQLEKAEALASAKRGSSR
uniref:Uncharacterized protein n=1 Tax=Mycena chlorophos TaxID=658473 RepID=A0ABQ0LNM0_MYCCL|nr:predicted protein [Mycena chlorophos]